MSEMIGSAMRLVAFLNVPSAVGLAVLGDPIIGLIYQHGRFGAADTHATGQALLFYALGLYAYSAVKVFAPAFYALDEPRTAVAGSILGMLSNVALNASLFPVLGFRGVALGTSLAASANFAVLVWAWRRRHGGLGGTGVVPQLGKVLAASAVLGVVAWASWRGLAGLLPPRGLGNRLVVGLGPVLAGGLASLGAARALRIAELDELVGAIRRRRRA